MPLRTGMKQKENHLSTKHSSTSERKDALSKEGRTTNRKPGICLKSLQFETLLSAMDSVQETTLKNEAQNWHLEYKVYVHVRENKHCVDIRQY